jgi:two-component system NarL family response regulator
MTESARKIRVLVIDDHKVVREGLRAMIGREADMEVVAEAGDGPSALAAQAAHQVDVILCDLRLPDVTGPELIVRLRAADPQAKILVLTSYDAEEDVFRAFQAGARGYLLKGTFPEGLLEEAIRTVHRGEQMIPPEVAARLAQRGSTPALTPREIAVLELCAKGLSNREIGAILSTSPGTIKTHLERIYAKLGVNDRTAAALSAIQRGIVTLS